MASSLPFEIPASFKSFVASFEEDERENQTRQTFLLQRQAFEGLDRDLDTEARQYMNQFKQTSVTKMSCLVHLRNAAIHLRLTAGLCLFVATIVVAHYGFMGAGNVPVYIWLTWATITLLSMSVFFFVFLHIRFEKGLAYFSRLAAFYLRYTKRSLALFLWSLTSCLTWVFLISPALAPTDYWSNADYYVTCAYVSIVSFAFIAVICGVTTGYVTQAFERATYVEKIQDALRASYLIVKYLTPSDMFGTATIELFARFNTEQIQSDPYSLDELTSYFRLFHFTVMEKRTVHAGAPPELVPHQIFDDELPFLVDVIVSHLGSTYQPSDTNNLFFNKISQRELQHRRRIDSPTNQPPLSSSRDDINFNMKRWCSRLLELSDFIPLSEWTEDELRDLPSTKKRDIEELWSYLFDDFQIPGGPELIVSRDLLVRALRLVFENRFELRVSLLDSQTSVSHVSRVFYVTGLFIWLIVVILVFAGGSSYNVFIAITGAFIAIAYIFGPMVETLFENCVFIFFRHPMGHGDLVYIDSDYYTVKRTELLSTTLAKWDGTIQQRANSSLSSDVIVNISRARELYQPFQFTIDIGAARGDFMRQFKALLHFFVTSPPHVASYTGQFSAAIIALSDPLQAQIQVWVELRYYKSRDLGTIYEDIHKINMAIIEILAILEVTRSGVGVGTLALKPSKGLSLVTLAHTLAQASGL